MIAPPAIRDGFSLTEVLVAAALTALVMGFGLGLWRNQSAQAPAARIDPGLSDDLQTALPLLRKDLRSSETFRLSESMLQLPVISLDATNQPTLATVTWTWDSSGMSRATTQGTRRFGPASSANSLLNLTLTLRPASSKALDLSLIVRGPLGATVFSLQEKLMSGSSEKQ